MKNILDLEQEFTGKREVKGFQFKQINQSDKTYIYQVTTGSKTWYEVFKKKTKTNSLKYCYPTSKSFGIWAWTCQTLERAIEKFEELNQ